MVVDLVDRLSTPIQFMSLAEKRTKQMKGMGFDENDISDEALTSSSSIKQHLKQETAPVLPASSTANGKTTATSPPRTTGPAASVQQVSTASDKKDKKGYL